MDYGAFVKKHKTSVIWLAAVAIVLAGMYWEVGNVFLRRAIGNEVYYHCFFVPPIVGWLLWRRKDQLLDTEHRPSKWGYVVLGIGLLIYLFAARTGVRTLTGMSFPFIALGIAGSVYGREVLRAAFFPAFVLFLALPYPQHALGMIAMPMQEISAAITGALAPLVGLEVIQEGIVLQLHGQDFVVAEECSGMHSLVALLLTGFVLIELFALEGIRHVAGIILIPPLVLAANVTRLVVVLLTAEYFGADLALGAVTHGFSDVIVYLAAVLTFILALGWLQRRPRPEPHPYAEIQSSCAK